MKKSFFKPYESIDVYKRLHISAKIDSHEEINDDTILGRNYVIYNVNIFTFYKNWIVQKRYSNFEDLHKCLQNKENFIVLPEFPPKRFFKNSDTTIKERKEKLEAYLNFIFKNVNVCSYKEILDFIEVEKELLYLLMKNNTMIENNISTAVKRYYSMKKKSNLEANSLKKARSVDYLEFSDKDNYYSSFLDYKLQDKNVLIEKSANMMVIEEFLRNLEYKFENQYNIIKTFEQFLKSKKNWPNFKRDEISKLFYGDTNLYSSGFSSNSISSDNSYNSINSLKGLFFNVGNIEQNKFGAEKCLEFLGKLIDYEYNPDCEAYIYILKTSKIEHLQSLRLEDHIQSNKLSIINICYRILKGILIEDKSMINKLNKLINNDEIIKKFQLWLDTCR